MKTTSVTELKNTLSAHLKRVKAGESLLVTDRRKPVAILQALRGGHSNRRMAELMASGAIAPARHPLDSKAFLNMPRASCRSALSRAIGEEREGR